MRDSEFEWDDRKAAANLARHGVSFADARLVFGDPLAIGREDRRESYGEQRYIRVGIVRGRLLHVAYTIREDRFRSFRRGRPNREKDGATMNAPTKKRMRTRTDWRALDAMTDEERHAAAMADPDARPMTDEEWEAAPRVPGVSILRRALRLSQQEFADDFCIPIGTLRDWEQGRKEPDAAAKAYLYVIAGEPEMVRKALAKGPRPLRIPSARPRRAKDARRETLGLAEDAAPRLTGTRKRKRPR